MTIDTPAARSVPDFAKLHGISRAFAYILIDRGVIVARKLGKRTVIFEADNGEFRSSLPVIQPKAVGQ